MESCFSTIALLARGNLSFDFALVIDNVHFLSCLSSSDDDPVQSRVAPPFDDNGTGCSAIIPVEGLKSISELLLVFIVDEVACDFDAALGKTIWAGKGPEGSEEVDGRGGISFGGELGGSPCKRASRRALSFNACWTSLRILGSALVCGQMDITMSFLSFHLPSLATQNIINQMKERLRMRRLTKVILIRQSTRSEDIHSRIQTNVEWVFFKPLHPRYVHTSHGSKRPKGRSIRQQALRTK